MNLVSNIRRKSKYRAPQYIGSISIFECTLCKSNMSYLIEDSDPAREDKYVAQMNDHVCPKIVVDKPA